MAILAPWGTALADTQNDANSGADAPNDASAALALGPGSFSGQLDPANGDGADWYALAPPFGHAWLLTFSAPGLKVVETSNGRPELTVEPAYVYSYRPMELGFTGNASGAYTFEVQDFVLPDLVVSGVTVSSEPFAGIASGPGQRDVAFTVSNVGPGDAQGATVFVDVVGALSVHQIYIAQLDVPAGGSVTIHAPWDATLSVGRFSVLAMAETAAPSLPWPQPYNPWDANIADNNASTWTYVLEPNTPGVDVAGLLAEALA